MDLDPKDTELVIGIVARIGVDTRSVVSSITNELESYRYCVHEVHVTDLLKAFSSKLDLVPSPPEKRFSSYIAACNLLRSRVGPQVMATLAIGEIVSKRRQDGEQPSLQSRTAYIINQTKRPEEFECLRKVYGEHYVQISCHADEDVRIQKLTARIAASHPEDPKSSGWDLEARKLVHIDESQEDEDFGQRVRQVFPLSDVIVNANSPEHTARGIVRFFRALFGDHSVTPTREEYGMQLANTASQRSSDLSRQVGAVILTRTMEIQALGCNEVPRAMGGTYWEDDTDDGRDCALGLDSNEHRLQAVLVDLMIRLNQAKALADQLSTREEIEKFLFERNNKLIARCADNGS
jgi:deoxycytidylate deaminase